MHRVLNNRDFNIDPSNRDYVSISGPSVSSVTMHCVGVYFFSSCWMLETFLCTFAMDVCTERLDVILVNHLYLNLLSSLGHPFNRLDHMSHYDLVEQ